MHAFSYAAIVAVLALVPTLTAQRVDGGADPDRRSSTVAVSSEEAGVLAAVSISYSSPAWQDSHDGMLEQLKGSNYTRLGKGWWTTFDTVGRIEIGGQAIEAGSYYLGLAVAKDGAWSLLLFDSGQAMKRRLLPGTTALYTGEARAELRAPMTLGKEPLAEVVTRLEIEIRADKGDVTAGRLSIRWGRHELSAPVRFHLAKERSDSP